MPRSRLMRALSGVLFADNNYIFQRLNIAPKVDSNGNPCNYVVLGLGPYCTIVGARSFGMFDAPVAFGEHSFEQPIVSYSRYLCVFRVYSDGTLRVRRGRSRRRDRPGHLRHAHAGILPDHQLTDLRHDLTAMRRRVVAESWTAEVHEWAMTASQVCRSTG